jgi:hypothetical protein
MPVSSPRDSAPVLPLDAEWLDGVLRSGWQGHTLCAGGDDVMDQSVLFWLEGKATERTLHLMLRLRAGCDARVRDHLQGHPSVRILHGSIPYPRKQIVAGEVHPLGLGWSMAASTAFDIETPDGIHLRYLPYEPEASLTFSAQGSLTASLPAAEGTLDEARDLLSELGRVVGIDTALSTAADLEYLYLRKVAFSLHLDVDGIEHDPAPLPRKLEQLRHAVSAQLGVADVTQLPRYNWRPGFCTSYNPWSDQIGSGRAGWPFWLCFDVPALDDHALSRFYLGHVIGATSLSVGDRLARLIRTTGHLLAPEERWVRLGAPSRSVNLPDGDRWGGGAFIPLTLLRRPDEATLVFHPELLRRLDAVALDGSESARTLSPQTIHHRLKLSDLGQTESCQVFFKRGVSLFDSLLRINLDSELDRSRVLEAFRNVGLSEVRGVPIEALVRVRQ